MNDAFGAKKSWNVNSGALSEWTDLMTVSYCVEIKLKKFGNMVSTSGFACKRYTHVALVQSSTIVRKYL